MAVFNHNNTTTKTAPKFLRALYDMLHYEDPAILAWSHDGTFFQVFDIHRLEQEVLAKYFKHSKFTSLQRQLNNFGFRKWTKTRANVCTFSHDVLRQCHPEELSEMVQRNKVTRVSSALNVGVSVAGKRSRVECEAATMACVSKKQQMSVFDSECVGSFVDALEEAMTVLPLDLDLELVLDCESDVDVDISLLFDGMTECQLLDLHWDNSVSGAMAVFSAASDAAAVQEEFGASTDLLMLSDDDVSLLLGGSVSELTCAGYSASNATVFTF